MTFIDRSSKKSVVSQFNSWEAFLSEANTGNSYKDSNVLLVGPRNTGKRSIINSIFQNVFGDSQNNNKVGTQGQTSALEYTYIKVANPEDPENDDFISKMNIWILDDPAMQDLLVHCLKEDTIENMIICICLDMTEPWNSLNTLTEWINIINDKISRVLKDMPLYKQDKLREKVAKYIKKYEEPQFDEEGKLIIQKRTNENPDEEEVDLPLPDGVLTVNCGVPIMILGTKSDGLEMFEKEKDGVYKLDFLQYSIRNFGLPYGATLLYMSLKQNINLDIFYDYLLHRFYGFGLKYKAEVVHKDSIFIPAGYDKPKIINETFQHIRSSDIFEEIIAQPTGKKIMTKEEVTVEDLQSFLVVFKQQMLAATDKDGMGGSKGSVRPSYEKEPGTGTTSHVSKGSISNKAPVNPNSFFKGLLESSTTGTVKATTDTTPSHSRAPSQQVKTNNSIVPDTTTGRMTTNSTQSTTSNTTNSDRMGKLMGLLKK